MWRILKAQKGGTSEGGVADQKKKWREEGWSEVFGTKPVFLKKKRKKNVWDDTFAASPTAKWTLGKE